MALSRQAKNSVSDIDDMIDREYVGMDSEEAIEFLREIEDNVRLKIETLKEENDL